MVFISGKPTDPILIVREAPAMAATIIAAIALGLFGLAVQFDQQQDYNSTWIVFALAIAALSVAACFSWLRTCVFDRASQTLTIRTWSLARRSQKSCAFSPGAHAVVVTDTSDTDGATYYAAFVPLTTGAPDSIELDDNSSFRRPSDRIAAAVNAWIAQEQVDAIGIAGLDLLSRNAYPAPASGSTNLPVPDHTRDRPPSARCAHGGVWRLAGRCICGGQGSTSEGA